jgi:transcriptional antiterminator NusG
MSTQTETSQSGVLDILKLLIAAGALVGGLYGYYFYENDLALPLRVLMVLGGTAAGIAIAMTSAQGQRLWHFIQGSRVEIRKVIWPTRTETTQTAIAVFVFTLILALLRGAWSARHLRRHMEVHQVALRWYIVHAYSNFEHKVKQSLEERIERMGLQDKFGEILVPTEEVVEMKEGSKRRSERKFFPGYVLVQMEMDDETWHLVKEVPKVLGFIGGSSDRPAPISDKEADQILQRVREGVDKPRPKVLFEPGEVVRVTDGPFNDFSGVVEAVNYEKSRLQVAVQILGRSTPVELDFGQVEKS